MAYLSKGHFWKCLNRNNRPILELLWADKDINLTSYLRYCGTWALDCSCQTLLPTMVAPKFYLYPKPPLSSSRSPNSCPDLKSLTTHYLTLEPHWGIQKAHRDFHSHGTEMCLDFAFLVFVSHGLLQSSGFHFRRFTMSSPLLLCRPIWYLHTHSGSLSKMHSFLLVIQGWIEWASIGLKTECSQ